MKKKLFKTKKLSLSHYSLMLGEKFKFKLLLSGLLLIASISFAQTTTQYEAENAILSGGASVTNNHTGYGGTGFVEGYWNAGATTTFTVDAAAAGSYDISLAYCNGNGSNNTISIYVNSSKIKQTILAPTGNWDTWGTTTETLNLIAGNNTISYMYDTGDNGSVNLDYITVPSGTPDTQAPSVPSALLASALIETSFTLSWTASSDNVSVTAYEVFQNGVSVGTTSSTSMSVSGLVSGTTYAMTVRATDAAGNWSAQSASLNATTATVVANRYEAESAILSSGASITNNHVGYSGTGFVEGFWNAGAIISFSVNVATAASYDVSLNYSNGFANTRTISIYLNGSKVKQISLNPSASWDSWSTKTETLTLNSGNNTINYVYDSGDNGNVNIDFIDVNPSSQDSQAPSVPSNLVSSNVSQTSFTLNWNASTDNVSVTGYEVFRNGTSIGTTSNTSMNVTGLSCGNNYNMTVSASDAAGNVSAQSASQSVSTLACSDTQAPTVPNGLSASSVSQTSFTLNWNASTDNEGVTAYEVFRNGTSIGTTSNTSLNVTGLSCDNSYNMTVSATDAAGNWSAQSASQNVSTSACSGAENHNIGLNYFAAQGDYCEDRLFADAMKTSREWFTDVDRSIPASTDSKGWPTEDARCVLWDLPNMNGTFYLEGNSAVNPTITFDLANNISIQNQQFSNGKFTATIINNSTNNPCVIVFANTNGGVNNVKLMRPTTKNGSTPYSTSVTFTDVAKNLIADVNVVRFMWLTGGWNGEHEKTWAGRVQPDHCSFNRGGDDPYASWAGYGIAWEYAIQFCNETGKDAWINIPIAADDDYIIQLANLWKNNYTVPNGKIYVEYSNEVTWCGWSISNPYAYHYAQTDAEAAAGGPIVYDGTVNSPSTQQILAGRRMGEMGVKISIIWRNVWGDANMMTRIRPVQCGFLGNMFSEEIPALEFVHNYYNNGDGVHVSDPHPVNYYFYGTGGSNYTQGDTGSPTELANYEKVVEAEAGVAKAFGLERTAYEGGVWTHASNWLLPQIYDAMIVYHQLWDKYDGDLFTYYVTTGGEDDGKALGFTKDAYDLNTPKYNALKVIASQPKAEVTAGKLAPCTIQGADFSAGPSHPEAGGAETMGIQQIQGNDQMYYLFRVDAAGTYNISAQFAGSADHVIEVICDGVHLGTSTVGSSMTTPFYNIDLNPGLHAVRIKQVVSNPNYFAITTVTIGSGQKSSEIVTSADQVMDNNALSIYPNPARDMVNIALHSTYSGKMTINVLDINGRMVKEINTIIADGENTQTVDISDLNNGIYLINIITDNKSITKRLDINK